MQEAPLAPLDGAPGAIRVLPANDRPTLVDARELIGRAAAHDDAPAVTRHARALWVETWQADDAGLPGLAVDAAHGLGDVLRERGFGVGALDDRGVGRPQAAPAIVSARLSASWRCGCCHSPRTSPCGLSSRAREAFRSARLSPRRSRIKAADAELAPVASRATGGAQGGIQPRVASSQAPRTRTASRSSRGRRRTRAVSPEPGSFHFRDAARFAAGPSRPRPREVSRWATSLGLGECCCGLVPARPMKRRRSCCRPMGRQRAKRQSGGSVASAGARVHSWAAADPGKPPRPASGQDEHPDPHRLPARTARPARRDAPPWPTARCPSAVGPGNPCPCSPWAGRTGGRHLGRCTATCRPSCRRSRPSAPGTA